jgi:AraC family transcriptional regulator
MAPIGRDGSDMKGRRFYGDPIAWSLGLTDAPSVMTRSLRQSQIAATLISCGVEQIGMTPQVPPEDTFSIAMYLTELRHHELWSYGRPLISQGYAKNSMRIVNLLGELSARIMCPHEALNLYVPRAVLDQVTEDAGAPRVSHLSCPPGIVDPVMVHLAGALLPVFRRPHEARSLYLDYVTLAIFSHLVHAYGGLLPRALPSKGGLTPTRARRAKELMMDDCDNNLLLADVARECGLSRQYFMRAFKATEGLTPHQWQQRYRVEKAKRLLRETSLPVAEIAIKCGFADQSHLTRIFTKIAGGSPAAWRREYRSNGRTTIDDSTL